MPTPELKLIYSILYNLNNRVSLLESDSDGQNNGGHTEGLLDALDDLLDESTENTPLTPPNS